MVEILPRSALHAYQVAAIAFLKQQLGRQVIAIMGAGKTTVALHAVVDLRQAGLLDGIIMVVAPLLIAETVWPEEAAHWQVTAHLRVVSVIGTAKQRLAALHQPADLHVINYDNLVTLMPLVEQHDLRFALVIADEASRLKTYDARRTQACLALAARAQRRWALTGTPRSQQLPDVWGPAQFCTNQMTFPAFVPWRASYFFATGRHRRNWYPLPGVAEAITARLRDFTMVVDQAALATRPPVVEMFHTVTLPPKAAALYAELETGSAISDAQLLAAGVVQPDERAVVGKLMQVISGAIYDGSGGWQRLHDQQLDMLAEIHDGHARPTLVFVNFRHEIARISERFPFARELTPALIDAWNAGAIEMLIAHPASAGHGVNLQFGSDTLVWFSLPWSAELFAQANARLVRQGQRGSVTLHLLVTADRIDRVALAAVRHRLTEQDKLIDALRVAS